MHCTIDAVAIVLECSDLLETTIVFNEAQYDVLCSVATWKSILTCSCTANTKKADWISIVKDHKDAVSDYDSSKTDAMRQ